MPIRVVSGKMEGLNPVPSMINLAPIKTVAASLVGLPLMISSVAAAEPSTPPMPNPQVPAESSSVQQLSNMFSPQIQSTIQACWGNGRADLAAGAGPEGALQCSDGESVPDIPYASYLNTVSDIFVASSLIGFRAAIASNSQVSPEMLASFLTNPDGAALLQNTVQMAVRQSQLVNPSSVESANVLTSEIMTRIMPVLSDPTQLDHLLGTPEQYSQVVQNFCTAPGMSVEQAQSLVPGMTSIQLYAVCVNESGVADEMMRLIN